MITPPRLHGQAGAELYAKHMGGGGQHQPLAGLSAQATRLCLETAFESLILKMDSGNPAVSDGVTGNHQVLGTLSRTWACFLCRWGIRPMRTSLGHGL